MYKGVLKHFSDNYKAYSLGLQAFSAISNDRAQQRQIDHQELWSVYNILQAEERERLQRLSEGFEGYKKRIFEFLEQQRWGEMANACEEAITQFIESRGGRTLLSNEKLVLAETYHFAAIAWFYSHQFEKAEEKCKESLTLNAKNSDYLTLGGKIALILGKMEDASEMLKTALALTSRPECRLILECYVTFIGCRASDVIKYVTLCQQENLTSEDEALLSMQGWAYLSRGNYLAAAASFKRTMRSILEISPLNTHSRQSELQVLTLLINICLSLRLIFDEDAESEIKLSLKRHLREVISLLEDYKKKYTKSTTQHTLTYSNRALGQYPCFINICLLNQCIGTLTIISRQFLSEELNVRFHFADRSEDFDELFEKQINENDAEKEEHDDAREKKKEKGKEKQKGLLGQVMYLLCQHLQISFEYDPYDAPHLLLLTGIVNIDVSHNIHALVQRAKANLAYCYLHAYRVRRNFVKAAQLLKDTECPRRDVEYAYMLWQGLLEGSDKDIEAAKKCVRRSAESVVQPFAAEYEDVLLAKFYLALFILQQNPRTREDTRALRSKALRDIEEAAQQGVILAQAWLANIYAFGYYQIPKNPVLAQKWISRAVSNVTAFNKPDYYFSCLIQSRMYREGEGYLKNVGKAREILLSIIEMGSIEAMLELGTLYWHAHIHQDGSVCHQTLFNATEEDCEAAVSLWENARHLGFDSRRENEDEKGALMYWDYALALLQGYYSKKINPKLAAKLFAECLRVSGKFTASYLENIRYCLGLLYLFSREAEIRNEDEAVRCLQQAVSQSTDRNYYSNSRALARLSALASQRQDALQGPHVQQAQNIRLLQTENLTLRPSIAANELGNIVLIFKDPSSQRIKVKLGNIKGTSVKWQFLAVSFPFEGTQFEHARIAINRNNTVVCSSYCTADRKIHYRIGKIEENKITWGNFQDNNIYTLQGSAPTIALNDAGTIMEAHCYREGGYLYHRLGQVNPHNHSIEWFSSEERMHFTNDAQTRFPALTMKDNQIIVAWKSGTIVQYRLGTLNNRTIQWGTIQNLNFNYMTPHFAFDTNRIILFVGGTGNDDGLYYRDGQINGQVINWNGNFENFEVGYWPTAIVNNQRITTFYEFDGGLNRARICCREIHLPAPQPQQRPASSSG